MSTALTFTSNGPSTVRPGAAFSDPRHLFARWFSSTGESREAIADDDLALGRCPAELVGNHLAEDAPALHRFLADIDALHGFAVHVELGDRDRRYRRSSFMPFAMPSPGIDEAMPAAPALTRFCESLSWPSGEPPGEILAP